MTRFIPTKCLISLQLQRPLDVCLLFMTELLTILSCLAMVPYRQKPISHIFVRQKGRFKFRPMLRRDKWIFAHHAVEIVPRAVSFSHYQSTPKPLFFKPSQIEPEVNCTRSEVWPLECLSNDNGVLFERGPENTAGVSAGLTLQATT
jgi:hypothetical protein